MEVSKRENLGPFQRKEKGHRHHSLAGRKRTGGIFSKLNEFLSDRFYPNDRNSDNGSRGDSFTCKKRGNKKVVGQNKTEKEINSLIKFKININFSEIINFLKRRKIL